MAWIDTINERDANGSLKDQYAKLKDSRSGVDNILKIHSLNPESLDAHVQLYKTIMYGKSPIRRVNREMIAVLVSSINQCHYWITHHGEGLLKLTKDESLVHQIISDYKIANISPAQMAMLDYASKLTERPTDMILKDVERLRDVGYTDRGILDINQIVSYFAYVNRVADGLGVELEDFWKKNA
jgi:uncharacterized peroxidase-related enzyme